MKQGGSVPGFAEEAWQGIARRFSVRFDRHVERRPSGAQQRKESLDALGVDGVRVLEDDRLRRECREIRRRIVLRAVTGQILCGRRFQNHDDHVVAGHDAAMAGQVLGQAAAERTRSPVLSARPRGKSRKRRRDERRDRVPVQAGRLGAPNRHRTNAPADDDQSHEYPARDDGHTVEQRRRSRANADDHGHEREVQKREIGRDRIEQRTASRAPHRDGERR